MNKIIISIIMALLSSAVFHPALNAQDADGRMRVRQEGRKGRAVQYWRGYLDRPPLTADSLLDLTGSALKRSVSSSRFALSFNAADVADFGTLNADVSYAVARRWSVNAGIKYNPWTFYKGDAERQKEARNRSVDAGLRFWPWNTYAGWWGGAKLRWQEYNRCLSDSRETEEGDAYGAGINLGYSLIFNRTVNFNFGLGLWAGVKVYTTYACPTCGRITDQGSRMFIQPSDIVVGVELVF